MFFNKAKSPQEICYVAFYRAYYSLDVDEIFDVFNGEYNDWIKNSPFNVSSFISDSLADVCHYLIRLGGPGSLKNTRYVFEVTCTAEEFRKLLRNDSDSFHKLIRYGYNSDDIIGAVRQVPGNRYASLHPRYFRQVDLNSKSIEKHVNPHYSTAVAKLTNLCEASSRWSSCAIL